MAILIQAYSNANSSSKVISVEFENNILADDFHPPSNTSSSCMTFYFKFSPNAQDVANVNLPIKFVSNISSLCLNNTNQRINGSTNAYSNITEMINDYVYDYINGHAANLYGSGCTLQLPMKF